MNTKYENMILSWENNLKNNMPVLLKKMEIFIALPHQIVKYVQLPGLL